MVRSLLSRGIGKGGVKGFWQRFVEYRLMQSRHGGTAYICNPRTTRNIRHNFRLLLFFCQTETLRVSSFPLLYKEGVRGWYSIFPRLPLHQTNPKTSPKRTRNYEKQTHFMALYRET